MSHLANYIERNLYDAGGHTGNTYYTRIVRKVDSKVWDPSNKEMMDESEITWENSTTLLVEEGSTGVFPIIISKDLPAGTYDIVVYKQLGSLPQSTDNIEKQWEIKHGSIFGF